MLQLCEFQDWCLDRSEVPRPPNNSLCTQVQVHKFRALGILSAIRLCAWAAESRLGILVSGYWCIGYIALGISRVHVTVHKSVRGCEFEGSRVCCCCLSVWVKSAKPEYAHKCICAQSWRKLIFTPTYFIQSLLMCVCTGTCVFQLLYLNSLPLTRRLAQSRRHDCVECLMDKL